MRATLWIVLVLTGCVDLIHGVDSDVPLSTKTDAPTPYASPTNTLTGPITGTDTNPSSTSTDSTSADSTNTAEPLGCVLTEYVDLDGDGLEDVVATLEFSHDGLIEEYSHLYADFDWRISYSYDNHGTWVSRNETMVWFTYQTETVTTTTFTNTYDAGSQLIQQDWSSHYVTTDAAGSISESWADPLSYYYEWQGADLVLRQIDQASDGVVDHWYTYEHDALGPGTMVAENHWPDSGGLPVSVYHYYYDNGQLLREDIFDVPAVGPVELTRQMLHSYNADGHLERTSYRDELGTETGADVRTNVYVNGVIDSAEVQSGGTTLWWMEWGCPAGVAYVPSGTWHWIAGNQGYFAFSGTP